MATPSSSATSPSPPMTYLPNLTASLSPISSTASESFEKDAKKKAVQKFLARAELSSVTRGLRARLSYASYKAAHGVPPTSLRDLEAHAQAQNSSGPFYRTNAAKRKAPGSTSFYGGPAAQSSAILSNPLRRGGSSMMAPPSGLASRTQFPPANGGAGTSAGASAESSAAGRAGSAGHSLFTSILAPPPSKHTRTILNAGDPFIPAAIRPAPSPQPRVAKSIAEGTRAHHKSKSSKHSPGTPDKRKAKRSSHKGRVPGVDADGDVEMKAAATLTSLLLNHHRPGASPRSSVDAGSDAGSTHSQPYPQFVSGSSRVIDSQPTVSTVASSTTPGADSFRTITPPPSSKSPAEQTTPRPAPADNEAADLMLFLATSPSPARRSSKDVAEANRGSVGSSGALRAKGRVLFPTASGSDADTDNVSRSTTPRVGSSLSRGGDSFTSSMSSISSEMGGSNSLITEGSSSTIGGSSSSHLLPPPQVSSVASPPTYRKIQDASPRPPSASGLDFNINDFINASPSPSRPAQKANLGLRADVGRRLFEEEQMRMGMSFPGHSGSNKHPEQHTQKGLGASIDLVRT